MNAEIKDCISKCSVCNSLKLEQCHEPIRPHKLPDQPWSKVGTDLFTYNSQNYIVTVDYYPNFIEMYRLRDTSSRTVIKALKTHFSRHGIPDILVSDNGPQYSSVKFHQFLQQWEFKHITSSHYPKSNGKAESAIKVCKNTAQEGKTS